VDRKNRQIMDQNADLIKEIERLNKILKEKLNDLELWKQSYVAIIQEPLPEMKRILVKQLMKN